MKCTEEDLKESIEYLYDIRNKSVRDFEEYDIRMDAIGDHKVLVQRSTSWIILILTPNNMYKESFSSSDRIIYSREQEGIIIQDARTKNSEMYTSTELQEDYFSLSTIMSTSLLDYSLMISGIDLSTVQEEFTIFLFPDRMHLLKGIHKELK